MLPEYIELSVVSLRVAFQAIIWALKAMEAQFRRLSPPACGNVPGPNPRQTPS
jgi:hypothetical protein